MKNTLVNKGIRSKVTKGDSVFSSVVMIVVCLSALDYLVMRDRYIEKEMDTNISLFHTHTHTNNIEMS